MGLSSFVYLAGYINAHACLLQTAHAWDDAGVSTIQARYHHIPISTSKSILHQRNWRRRPIFQRSTKITRIFISDINRCVCITTDITAICDRPISTQSQNNESSRSAPILSANYGNGKHNKKNYGSFHAEYKRRLIQTRANYLAKYSIEI